MNGRQRLLNMLSGKPKEGLSWTTLVDDTTRSVMPPHFQEMTSIDFYKTIGCDIFQFGNYGLPPSLMVPDPSRWVVPGAEVKEYMENGLWVRKIVTPWGELTATFAGVHPVKYPVENITDLHLLKKIWDTATYEIDDSGAGIYQQVDDLIGEDGIYAPTVMPSPVQSLLEYEMGMTNFYYLLQDYPLEMEALLESMRHCRQVEYDLLAQRTPAAAVISVENTSTTSISPAIYKKYSLPHLQDFVTAAHAHNKRAILHMCGHLKKLLPYIKETGLDGVHALTPPPIGNTPYELAWDILGEQVTLIACLDSSVFHNPKVTAADIPTLLDRVYTPRLRTGNFVLAVVADGLPTPLWKFEVVREWMEKNRED